MGWDGCVWDRTPHTLTCGALALKAVDLVDAHPIVQAGLAGALVGIDLAVDSLVACQLTWRIIFSIIKDRGRSILSPSKNRCFLFTQPDCLG